MKHFTASHLTFIAAGLLTILVLSALSMAHIKATGFADTARGVDVYLVARDQNTTVGEPFTADIVITNDRTPLNVMEAEVYFDPALFVVNDFSFADSLCEERFVIDRVIDNTAGRLHLSCGTITPFTGNAAIFGTITATPLAPGITEVTFGEKTHVYVHDGLGTEIARDTYGAMIAIDAGA